MPARGHERELLDALQALPAGPFAGDTWRVAIVGREALRGSAAGGRWSPPGEFDVLYTSLSREGALAEIGYRLSLEPVWPSRIAHALHRIRARTTYTLRFADLASLAPLGVDGARYGGFDYAATQAIAAAAFFLDFDGLIVPSARSVAHNLVLFLDKLEPEAALHVAASETVDWVGWRRGRHGARGPRR
ncbi:MAG: RES family NAD+ phosphorylase [Rhodospirillales bacterium]|nr:RES family NAD+ phosphorylase [Rhodospirillales bacterium]